MRNTLRVLSVLVLGVFLGTAFGVDIAADIEMSAYYGRAINFLDQDVANDEAAYLRSEAYLYFSQELSENVYVVLSLVSDFVWGHATTSFDEGLETSYFSDPSDLTVAIDTLYVDCGDILGMEGLGAVLGRQYITKGDAWVLGDANPYGEGDITTKGEWVQDPFDAINVCYIAPETDVRVDVGIAKLGEAAPLQRGKGNDDLDVYWVYLEYRGIEDHDIDVYGILKHDSGIATTPEQSIFAVGARAAGDIAEGFTYVGEITFEFGDSGMENVDKSAMGGHIGVGYDAEQWSADLGFVYFGGDDEADEDDEVFDQLCTDMTLGQIMRGPGRAGVLLPSGITPGWGIITLAFDFTPTEDWQLGLAGWYWMEMGTDYEESYEDLGLIEINGYAAYQMTDEVEAKLMAGVGIPEADEIGGDSMAASDICCGDTENAWFVRGSVTVEL